MVSRRVVRRRRQVLAGGLLLVAAVSTAAAVSREDAAPAPQAPAAAPVPPSPSATAARSPATTAASAPDPVDADPDRAAGVLERRVPDAGTGRRVTVPGTSAAAPAAEGARVVQTRVQVEEGLPADHEAVAGTVMAALQDERGWAPDGWAFARTDDAEGSPAPDLTVVVAGPDLTDDLCAPLRTRGRLSCAVGDVAVLTWYRWVEGAEAYGEDRAGYRQYLVSHEVGHTLGHGHVGCPGEGEPAPVMLQQTKGLQGCAANPWPHP
ncbi:DUF3152 domain-containing protein [Pseudokineococcus lusitanus]|uniref:Uncharacterized protein DUF3152 n=1 Tax=Pseudokineococcus lusitanus TaxID=763993 RepID=A0A3N1HN91_9ACTN|nr:DUF3152 domain-containing protein [Pseudokineococcus lusitanus]ROP43920.1 uncharacterized protein DUF3152 [Pseudokineococcus lusitanus]